MNSSKLNLGKTLVEIEVKKTVIENLKIGKKDVIVSRKFENQFLLRCKKIIAAIILGFTAFAVFALP